MDDGMMETTTESDENYDSNTFLVDQFWHNVSTQITSNLVDVATYKTRMNAAEVQEDLSIQKRMALQLAILSQVHMAHKDYSNSIEVLEQARAVSDLDEEISNLVDISARNEVEIELERIKSSASATSFVVLVPSVTAMGALLFL